VTEDRLDLLDYYTLLSVDPTATADAVRQAFHRFALKYHPDNHTGGGAERLARANQIYRRGAEAYRVLSNPQTRREYDAQLALGKLRYEPSSTGESRRPAGPRSRPVSPKARPFYARAQKALREQNLQQARLNLQIALGHDPGHEALLALLAEIEAAGG
jgi:curved DNA-binding protein CbpA